jgi:hypothetical protein
MVEGKTSVYFKILPVNIFFLISGCFRIFIL